jgi:signal transduction histidine kinase
MGMSIVAGIVNALRGHIHVETGELTTFTLVFPDPTETVSK